MNVISAVVVAVAFVLYSGGIYRVGFASGRSQGWIDAKEKEANDGNAQV